MRKKGFSAEILCLFFIISVTILFGKILLDVKSIISVKINQLIPQKTITVDYNAYSYRIDEVYEELKKVNVIRNIDDLKEFKEYLVDKNISVEWLDEKLDRYNKEEFNDCTIVVLSIVNDDNITVTRITGINKKNNDLTIRVNRYYKSNFRTNQYTWLAVLEISDINSQILLDIN